MARAVPLAGNRSVKSPRMGRIDAVRMLTALMVPTEGTEAYWHGVMALLVPFDGKPGVSAR